MDLRALDLLVNEVVAPAIAFAILLAPLAIVGHFHRMPEARRPRIIHWYFGLIDHVRKNALPFVNFSLFADRIAWTIYLIAGFAYLLAWLNGTAN